MKQNQDSRQTNQIIVKKEKKWSSGSSRRRGGGTIPSTEKQLVIIRETTGGSGRGEVGDVVTVSPSSKLSMFYSLSVCCRCLKLKKTMERM